MRDYRLYHLDSRGHVAARHEFRAIDDKEAIGRARTDHDDHTCEIWELARRVALVPRGGPVHVFDEVETRATTSINYRGIGGSGEFTANILKR